jgi:hypothetical protein
MVLLNETFPIDTQDKATTLFFKLVRFNHKANRADLASLKERFGEALREQEKSPTAEYSENLHQFFESRTSGDGWGRLDGIFHHMVGKTLSDVVDGSLILFGEDDHELSRDEFFSVMLRVRRTGDGDEGTSFHEIRRAAIASDIDRILRITQEVAGNYIPLFNSSLQLDNRSTNGRVIVDELNRWKPCAMDVHQNNKRLMSLIVYESSDGGSYEIDWAGANLIRPSQELISSIAGIAPRAGNILKGRYLEQELGL